MRFLTLNSLLFYTNFNIIALCLMHIYTGFANRNLDWFGKRERLKNLLRNSDQCTSIFKCIIRISIYLKILWNSNFEITIHMNSIITVKTLKVIKIKRFHPLFIKTSLPIFSIHKNKKFFKQCLYPRKRSKNLNKIQFYVIHGSTHKKYIEIHC